MRTRELCEGLLVTYSDKTGQAAGIVESWNETAVFVRYYDLKTCRFNKTPTGTALTDLLRGGRIYWKEQGEES